MLESDGKFIKLVSEGKNIHTAYKEIYGTEESKASKLLNKPEFIEELNKQGITLRRLNNTLKKQLVAKKAIVVGKNSNIEYVNDNVAIDNALTKGYKLYGVLKDNPPIIDNRSIIFTGDVSQLAKVVNEMKELESNIIDTEGDVI